MHHHGETRYKEVQFTGMLVGWYIEVHCVYILFTLWYIYIVLDHQVVQQRSAFLQSGGWVGKLTLACIPGKLS